ncbi:MAG: 16S rRNA (adenine(1518)-N(6)/adenine(1519)-N(6))-dimethyltransferase RsmA [Gemmataceae bacterium]
MPPTTRQTLSYLRTLFQERGIRPRNKLGQNFLIDLNLLDLVVRSAEIGPADLVLEVGSGTGSLTMRLLESAGAVMAVEVDPPFAALTREAVESHFHLFSAAAGGPGTRPEHVKLIHADILERKNALQPEVLEGLRALLAASGTTQIKLIANLPYAVAVPVISNLLLCDLPIERMVVMVQWEIAERLMAVPGTKDYAAMAVLVQSLTEVSLVRKIPPTAFWPRPQVDSAIVQVRPSEAKRALLGDPQRFRNFLRDLYVHRRKNLRGGLASLPGQTRSKAEIDQALATLDIDGAARAETLNLEQHRQLSEVFG